MMSITSSLNIPARSMEASLFLVSGIGKLVDIKETQQYMEAYNVPGILVWPAAVFEVGSAAALLVGWRTRQISFLLAGWCLLTASIFHTDFKDQDQQIHLLKNVALAGSFLLIAVLGAT